MMEINKGLAKTLNHRHTGSWNREIFGVIKGHLLGLLYVHENIKLL